MRPEILTNAYGMPDEVGNALIEKNIHVVCTAQNGLTMLNGMAVLYCRLDRDLVSRACVLVNKRRETGTLYPQANISILPRSEPKNSYNKDYPNLSYDELEACIKDVFLANNNYIKSEIIVFYLDAYLNGRWAREIIHKIIESGLHNDTFVTKVYIS